MTPGPDHTTGAASEVLFRLLVEGATDYAIFLLNPNGYIMSWNAGAERIKGYRTAEAIGLHFSDFYPPDARADGVPARELEAARSAGRVEDEGWRLRKDGTRFWAHVTITALPGPDGTPIGFSKITRNLTERRAVEDALRASEQRFRLLAENARDVIFRFEYVPEPRYEYVSPAIQELTGFAPEEFYADPAIGLLLDPPG